MSGDIWVITPQRVPLQPVKLLQGAMQSPEIPQCKTEKPSEEGAEGRETPQHLPGLAVNLSSVHQGDWYHSWVQTVPSSPSSQVHREESLDLWVTASSSVKWGRSCVSLSCGVEATQTGSKGGRLCAWNYSILLFSLLWLWSHQTAHTPVPSQ
jgi:hypothetical protein